MPGDGLRHASPDLTGSVGSVDPAEIEQNSERATWGSHRGRMELYIKSDRIARITASALVVLIAIGAALWAWRAAALVRVPVIVCAECSPPPDWFRGTQLILAVVGTASALLAMAYLVYFAGSGRVWRRWRGVTATFGILAAAWALLVWANRTFG